VHSIHAREGAKVHQIAIVTVLLVPGAHLKSRTVARLNVRNWETEGRKTSGSGRLSG